MSPAYYLQNYTIDVSEIVVAGGGLLPKGSLTSDTEALGRMNGTIVIVRAEDEGEVWSFLRQDVFYTSGEVVCSVTVKRVNEMLTTRMRVQWDNSTIEVTPVLLGAPKID